MSDSRPPTLILDDADFGCPVGGMLIAGYRPTPQQFAWALVPVECFQSPRFEQKEYPDGTTDATQRGLSDLGETPDDAIAICQGKPHAGANLARCTRTSVARYFE